jgi:hypothetical protein
MNTVHTALQYSTHLCGLHCFVSFAGARHSPKALSPLTLWVNLIPETN